jgi:hypothetical protein
MVEDGKGIWYDSFKGKKLLFGEAWKWWMSIDKDNKWNMTWAKFEKLFSDKWIRDTKIKEMYGIQDELKEENEEIKTNGDELSKI